MIFVGYAVGATGAFEAAGDSFVSCLPAACLNAVTGLVIGYSGEGVTEGEVRVPVEGGLTAGSRWDSPTRRICQNCPCSVVVASMPWVLVSRTEPGVS